MMKTEYIVAVVAVVLLVLFLWWQKSEHLDANPLDGYTLCADEGKNCGVVIGDGNRKISFKYGAGGKFVEKQLEGSGNGSINALCGVSSFGSDPAPNVLKQCWYKNTPSPNVDPLDGYKLCANYGEECSKIITTEEHKQQPFDFGLKYGANGMFRTVYEGSTSGVNYRGNINLGGKCDDKLMAGIDPAYGTYKKCYVKAKPSTVAPKPDVWPTMPAGYDKQCAVEGGQCNFNGTRTVFYGADGKYIPKLANGGVACNVSTFGFDPAYGVHKACYTNPNLVGMPVLSECAKEGGTCDVRGKGNVYYGANGMFVSQNVSTNFGEAVVVPCTVASFGTDPAPNMLKSCYSVIS